MESCSSSETTFVHDNFDSKSVLTEMLDSLQTLSTKSDQIFSRLLNRIQVEHSRLKHNNKRIDICQKKIHAIRGSTKATAIFSIAKFPASKHLPLYTSTFQPNFDNDQIKTKILHNLTKIESNYLLSDNEKAIMKYSESTNELLQLYLSYTKNIQKVKKVEFLMEEEGLGSIPKNLYTLDSLLLFNSNINPYKNYKDHDNLHSAGRTKSNETDGNQIGSGSSSSMYRAPSSIVSRDVLPDVMGMDLSFRPENTLLSSLPLPSNLPLEYLAGSGSDRNNSTSSSNRRVSSRDLRYSGTVIPSPSVEPALRSKMNSLPNQSQSLQSSLSSSSMLYNPMDALPSLPGSNSNMSMSMSLMSIPTTLSTTLLMNSQAPPPPLGPSSSSTVLPSLLPLPSALIPSNYISPITQSSSSSSSSTMSDVNTSTAIHTMSPPPPNSHAMMSSDTTVTTTTGPSVPSTPSPSLQQSGIMDASMLTAIRSMSVKNLKPASETSRTTSSASSSKKKSRNDGEENTKPKPLSMMEEMRERMGRRKRAMAGRTDSDQKQREADIIAAATAASQKTTSTSNTSHLSSHIPPMYKTSSSKPTNNVSFANNIKNEDRVMPVLSSSLPSQMMPSESVSAPPSMSMSMSGRSSSMHE
eukprot:gene8482-17481_t